MIPLRCLFLSVKGQTSAMTVISARCSEETRETQANPFHAQAVMTQSPAQSLLPPPPPPSAPPRCHSLRGAHPPCQPLSAAPPFDTCDELGRSSESLTKAFGFPCLLINPSKGVCRGKTAARGKLRHSAMGQRSMGNWVRQKAL